MKVYAKHMHVNHHFATLKGFLTVIFLVIVASNGVETALGGEVIRIMPLGDSITMGDFSTSYNGYRKPLYRYLKNDGYPVNFVGSTRNGSGKFDKDHEGHGGWGANTIGDNIYWWLVSNPADCILLHIGTNNITWGQDPDTVLHLINYVLDRIDDYESDYDRKITVFLARILRRPNDSIPGHAANTLTLNKALKAMAIERIAAGDRLVLVNQDRALNYVDDMADAVHPNDRGYKKMAVQWRKALWYYFHPPTVTVKFLRSSDSAGREVFSVQRTGSKDLPLLVRYEVTQKLKYGTATRHFKGATLIPVDHSTWYIKVSPIENDLNDNDYETTSVKLLGNPSYKVGYPNRATVTVR